MYKGLLGLRVERHSTTCGLRAARQVEGKTVWRPMRKGGGGTCRAALNSPSRQPAVPEAIPAAARRPRFLYGYGGFEISETPSDSPNFGIVAEPVRVFVVAQHPRWLRIRTGVASGASAEPARRLNDSLPAWFSNILNAAHTPRHLGIMGGSNVAFW